MPRNQRHATKYPGVFFIEGQRHGQKNQIEKIYYITFRKNGKRFEEKAGCQFKDDMTPERSSYLRGQKIEGKELPNKIKREQEKREKAEKWTFDKLWVEYKKIHSDAKAIKTDNYRYERHIKSRLGYKEPKDLILLDIDRIRIDLLKRLKPGTVRNILEQIKRVANFGVDEGLCEGVRFRIKMPKIDSLKTEDLTPAQLSKLLKAIEEDKHPHGGAMMKLVLFTGMRRGELFRLKWKDIDFQRDIITLKNPKGGKDQTIPLNDEAKELLKNHHKTKGSDYVFPGRDGKQMRFINYYLRGIKKRAGLPKDFRCLHGLRHVYGSLLASSGKVDLYQIQRLLTHKSPAMTQRYAHLRDSALRRAASVATVANYLK